MTMKTRYILSLIPCLLLGLAPRADALADRGHRSVKIEVLNDNGRSLRQYPVRRQGRGGAYRAYLEAKRGKNYAIRVSNNSAHRIGVVIAVDGRNIISGKRSQLRPDERMYVLRPDESAVYEGWRVARNRVNRFYFTDSADSYAEAFQDRSAMGVIAVATFREKRYEARPEYELRHGMRRGQAKSQPGTGFGESEWSPSVQVEFEPEHRPVSRHFLKYEWRKTLCRKGVIDCRDSQPKNRFWPDDEGGYAPYPPGHEETWRKNYRLWMYD